MATDSLSTRTDELDVEHDEGKMTKIGVVADEGESEHEELEPPKPMITDNDERDEHEGGVQVAGSDSTTIPVSSALGINCQGWNTSVPNASSAMLSWGLDLSARSRCHSITSNSISVQLLQLFLGTLSYI